ncbi:hypothetical protein [Peribacillus tepidiphilus]|nr:hypothetical protein [Peribacillus tepidiphilus]
MDGQVRDAVAKGASLITGGCRMRDHGLDKGTYKPTL